MTEDKKVITIDDVEVAFVSGFDDTYYISKSGSLFSTKKSRCRKVDGYYAPSGTIHANGYRYFTLMRNGKSVKEPAHRLVAYAFIENPESKPCVNHIDGNKLNNDLSNLEWVSYSENASHAYDLGLRKRDRPEASVASAKRRSSITQDDAVGIVKALKKNPKLTYKQIGDMYGCKPNTVHRVITGKQKYFKEAA
ncbi:HNH endonuclease [Crocinitomicaceae bacterium]|nr:HNH endonuclease [Crocinitomicaceae bacterium]